jgi:hypothetical protein
MMLKSLLIPLAFVAGQALACPDDASKDAMAPAATKPVVAAKATPSNKATVASTKAVTKVATKASVEPRKPASM